MEEKWRQVGGLRLASLTNLLPEATTSVAFWVGWPWVAAVSFSFLPSTFLRYSLIFFSLFLMKSLVLYSCIQNYLEHFLSCGYILTHSNYFLKSFGACRNISMAYKYRSSMLGKVSKNVLKQHVYPKQLIGWQSPCRQQQVQAGGILRQNKQHYCSPECEFHRVVESLFAWHKFTMMTPFIVSRRGGGRARDATVEGVILNAG